MLAKLTTDVPVQSDFWGYLKSIEHALKRAEGTKSAGYLTELDRDRLDALSSLLRGALEMSTIKPSPALSSLFLTQRSTPDFATGIDLSRRIRTVPEFGKWMEAKGIGPSEAIAELTDTLDSLKQDSPDLFNKKIPVEDIQILRAVVRDLLGEIKASLL